LASLAQPGAPNVLISLDAIRQEAGTRWQNLRNAAYAWLEALLRLRLAPTDFFLPVDEVSYLVSMPKSTEEDARVSCLRILFELHSSLIGPCSMSQLRIADACNVGGDVLELTPIAGRQLAGLAERAQIINLLVVKGDEAADAVLHAPPQIPLPEREDAGHEFVPVWDVFKEVIWAYRCEPVVPSSDTTIEPPHVPAERVLATLRRSASALEEHFVRDERFLVIVPIPYATLAAPVSRMELVSACRQLSCNLRPYLVFKIAQMPVGVPHSRLVDLVGSFRSFCRSVVAQTRADMLEQSLYEGAGLASLGFSLARMKTEIPRREMQRLSALGRRLGIGTFLDGVGTADELGAAIDAGVQWLSGPAIAPALPEPKPMSRLRKQNVLQTAASDSLTNAARG